MSRNENFFHGNIEQSSQRIEVIDGRQALAFLPLVDCLGFFKTEVPLEIPDGQAFLLPQPQNVFTRCYKVNNREFGLVHGIASFMLFPDEYYKIID